MAKADKNMTQSNLKSSIASEKDVADGKTKPSTLHSKYMFLKTSNGEYISLVSTYNLHPRSSRYEEEMAVVVKSPSSKRGLWSELNTWFHEKDPLVAASGSHMSTVTVTKENQISFVEPKDFRDPRSRPKTKPPEKGTFIMINSGVAAAMIIGYDQL